MYFFTADEHYSHKNIIKYCNRPFDSIQEMDDEIINRNNKIVSKNDIVVHIGDFAFAKKELVGNYIKRLNGNHIFLKGSHDRWLPKSTKRIWHKKIEGQYIVACHWAMRVWHQSRYGSWQLFGHSHGMLEDYDHSF